MPNSIRMMSVKNISVLCLLIFLSTFFLQHLSVDAVDDSCNRQSILVEEGFYDSDYRFDKNASFPLRHMDIVCNSGSKVMQLVPGLRTKFFSHFFKEKDSFVVSIKDVFLSNNYLTGFFSHIHLSPFFGCKYYIIELRKIII